MIDAATWGAIGGLVGGLVGGLITGSAWPWLHWHFIEQPRLRREYRQRLIEQGVMNEAGQYFYSDGRPMP